MNVIDGDIRCYGAGNYDSSKIYCVLDLSSRSSNVCNGDSGKI